MELYFDFPNHQLASDVSLGLNGKSPHGELAVELVDLPVQASFLGAIRVSESRASDLEGEVEMVAHTRSCLPSDVNFGL